MVQIRRAEVGDVPAITDLVNALLTTTTYEWTETPYTLDDRALWLHTKVVDKEPVLVATEDDLVVGYGTYGDFRDSRRRPGYRFTVEHTVHVAPSHWGRGVARALMDSLVDVARHRGKRVMIGAIDGTNARSLAVHERLGFREVGRLPGIGEKWGRRLDLVLVQRDL